jgi:hypothetical protein
VWAVLALLLPVVFNRVYRDAPITVGDMAVGVVLAAIPLVLYWIYRFIRAGSEASGP